jgi:hypothetical protein
VRRGSKRRRSVDKGESPLGPNARPPPGEDQQLTPHAASCRSRRLRGGGEAVESGDLRINARGRPRSRFHVATRIWRSRRRALLRAELREADQGRCAACVAYANADIERGPPPLPLPDRTTRRRSSGRTTPLAARRSSRVPLLGEGPHARAGWLAVAAHDGLRLDADLPASGGRRGVISRGRSLSLRSSRYSARYPLTAGAAASDGSGSSAEGEQFLVRVSYESQA